MADIVLKPLYVDNTIDKDADACANGAPTRALQNHTLEDGNVCLHHWGGTRLRAFVNLGPTTPAKTTFKAIISSNLISNN